MDGLPANAGQLTSSTGHVSDSQHSNQAKPPRDGDGCPAGLPINTRQLAGGNSPQANTEHTDATVNASADSQRPAQTYYNTRQAAGANRNTHKTDQHTTPTKSAGLLGRTAPSAIAAGVNDWTPAFLAEQQRLDVDICPALQWMATGKPDWKLVKAESPALRALWQQYDSLRTREGVLHRAFYHVNGSIMYYQVVLPTNLKAAFLELVHDGCTAGLPANAGQPAGSNLTLATHGGLSVMPMPDASRPA